MVRFVMFRFWTPRARTRVIPLAAVLLAALTACAPATPPVPTATTAAKTEAKPAESPTTAPAAASPAAAAASPVAAPSPVAASPTVPAPASPSPSPAAAASPGAVASPVAVVPPPVPVVGAASPNGAARIAAVNTLPDVPISAFQNARLPGTVQNDRKLMLGGIGSDIWHQPGDPPDQFWVVTDRGPNGQVLVDIQNRRTFPIPEYTPTILKVRAANGTIEILETIPVVGQSGKPVTGVSNTEGRDEVPWDFTAETQIPYNPNGLDTEGMVRTAGGDFWLAEEYSPSILKVDASGKVVKRFVPEGLGLTGTDYPVVEALPAIYNKRKFNRGFEGLALSPDQKTIYVPLQSPLSNPDALTGNPSRLVRILAFDIASEKVTGEYVYQFEPVTQFDTTAERLPTEMKISGIVALNADSLLVLERTDWVAKLYRADLKPATNLLGTPWDDPATSPSLEGTEDPDSAQIKVMPKTLVVDLHEIEGVPDKIEGVTILDKNSVVIANDNDFDIGTFDESGNNVGNGVRSRMLVISLREPLPLP